MYHPWNEVYKTLSCSEFVIYIRITCMCYRNVNKYYVYSVEHGIYFSRNYWNVIMKKLSLYIIHLRKSLYRNVNPYGFSESLRNMYLLLFVYTLFLSPPNTIRFFLCRVVNNKTIVFRRHWFGGSSSGKLDSHISPYICIRVQLNAYFSREKRQILFDAI